ncbi:LacI family DNA-binding transcriptional regulator [Frigoribacterium faeni]|uniref:LacI family DNA-binding transcriptional regulator n=1 Tax=Frigoribacterium faeni TaxID=145483 RepID=UPI00141AFF68|nr:LacI family DNA-binding transcriptional regulator [Frigoribacterium faeni]NIJ05494.1 LacI family transcriptional regulator [Frigoribacterium faeni]
MTVRPPERPPTVRDVASAAGVSVATVSRVLSGSPKRVADEARDRVLEAASRLGYSVNTAAKALATGHTGNVGILVPDLGNRHFTMIVRALTHEARASGFHVFIGDSVGSEAEEAALAGQMALRSDGLVLCSPRASSTALAPVLTGAKPVVTVNRRFRDAPRVSSVVVDVLPATRDIVGSMLELGHRHFAYVGASSRSRQNRRRWTLISELVTSAGGTVVEEGFDVDHPDLGSEVRRLLGLGCTALVAANDMVAAAITSTLTELGVAVPEQVSVSGWDDTALARWITPQLTTAGMLEDEVARAAWSAMSAMLVAPDEVSHVEMSSNPVFRDSIGPVPTTGPTR